MLVQRLPRQAPGGRARAALAVWHRIRASTILGPPSQLLTPGLLGRERGEELLVP